MQSYLFQTVIRLYRVCFLLRAGLIFLVYLSVAALCFQVKYKLTNRIGLSEQFEYVGANAVGKMSDENLKSLHLQLALHAVNPRVCIPPIQ